LFLFFICINIVKWFSKLSNGVDMKTFKQMNEDIQHQKQLNEKGFFRKIRRAKDAAIASFKSDPEKHAERMKNISNRAKAQDAEHEKAKAALSDKSKSNAKKLGNLKGLSKGYNITKKGNADNPNSMRPKGKHGSFWDSTVEHNPGNKGSMAPHPKGDWVDAAGNTGKHTRIAMTHSSTLSASRISATENRLNDPAEKERKKYHGNNPAEERVITIKKHITKLKAHGGDTPEAKERLAHAEHTLKLHHDAHKAAGAHLETHGEHEFTTSHYGHYHDHHYGNGEQDHHYDEMEKHKKAEQNNPNETHIDNARLGYDHTHHDHPHHEEEQKADVATSIPKHAATFHKVAKTSTAAHEAYNKMVDSQKKAESDLPKGTKSKTKLNKKAAYNKVDVEGRKKHYEKALASVNPEHNEIIKNLGHVGKDNKQTTMNI